MVDKKEKIDYSEAYKMICVNNSNKIIGYLKNYEAIGKNPVTDLFSDKVVGYALTPSNASNEEYYNKVYEKVKYNDEKASWEPDSNSIGKVIGNITRVLFESPNKNFKVNVDALASIAVSGGDSIHEDTTENQASTQFRNGLHNYYESKIDNSKLGLDSGSIKAAKDLLDSDLKEKNLSKNKKVFAKYPKLYELVSGKKIEPDKDGNMEIEKFEELSLVYYSFTTNITVILAAVMIAVLARKKKKQQEKNNDDEKSLSDEVNNQRREEDDYSFSQFNKDEDLGGEFQLYGVSPEDLGLEDDYGLGDDIIIKSAYADLINNLMNPE